jgi:hypothetical protein
MTQLFEAFLTHLGMAALVVTMTSDVVVELPLHSGRLPEHGSECLGSLHLHGVIEELPDRMGVVILGIGPLESAELGLESAITPCLREWEKARVCWRMIGRVAEFRPEQEWSEEVAGILDPASDAVMLLLRTSLRRQVSLGPLDL